jgi:hypothetical protein
MEMKMEEMHLLVSISSIRKAISSLLIVQRETSHNATAKQS